MIKKSFLSKAFKIIPENGMVIFQTADKAGLVSYLDEFVLEFQKREILVVVLDPDVFIHDLSDKDLASMGLVRILSKYDREIKTH